MRQILQQMEQAESRNAQLLQQLQQAEQQATQQARQLQQLINQIDVGVSSTQQVSPTFGYQGVYTGTPSASFNPQGATSFFGSYSGSYSQPKTQENFGYGGSQF